MLSVWDLMCYDRAEFMVLSWSAATVASGMLIGLLLCMEDIPRSE